MGGGCRPPCGGGGVVGLRGFGGLIRLRVRCSRTIVIRINDSPLFPSIKYPHSRAHLPIHNKPRNSVFGIVVPTGSGMWPTFLHLSCPNSASRCKVAGTTSKGPYPTVNKQRCGRVDFASDFSGLGRDRDEFSVNNWLDFWMRIGGYSWVPARDNSVQSLMGGTLNSRGSGRTLILLLVPKSRRSGMIPSQYQILMYLLLPSTTHPACRDDPKPAMDVVPICQSINRELATNRGTIICTNVL